MLSKKLARLIRENLNNNMERNTTTENKHAKTNGVSKKEPDEKSTSNNKPGTKSVLWTYILWFFGGLFGAHHFYLERDEQALVWLTSVGGYFGCGWLRDLFKIPTYVADVNNCPHYNEWFKDQLRHNRKPPFSMVRFLGAFGISSLWANVLYIAIPNDEVYGINFKQLYILIPVVAALGTWIVGNIGRERGSIWAALIGAYICYPTLYYYGDENMWIIFMSLASTLAFDSFSKEWRLKPRKKQPASRRVLIVALVVLIYGSCWASYLCFNATVVDSEGEEIKLSDAVKHFFTSPIWMDVKTSVQHMWTYAQHQGFWAVWKELIDLSDPRGEINAYKVLGLSQTASQSEVTSKWRALSREHHPDKVKGSEAERRAAQEKFMEIQQAYEILSSSKSRRQRKNRKPT